VPESGYEPDNEGATRRKPEIETASDQKHILMVEDEAILAMSEKLQLEKYGYAVRTVTTGEDAVELIATSPDIDLILMDIDLGNGIDGTRAALLILENHDIPIVFLSSHTEPEIVKKTEQITSYGYVVKSSSMTVLDASIKMAFRLFDANRNLTRELSERTRTEIALQESEEKFRALFEQGPIGVAYHRMIYDDAGNPVDYLFLDANRSYQELTGVDPRGKRVTEAFPGIENDPADWIGTFGRVARTGEQIRFEQYLEPNDRWYDCVGYQLKPDYFVAAFVEITKRKRYEKELTSQKRYLEKILEATSDGLWIVTPDKRITDVNSAYCRMSGYTRGELTRMTINEIDATEDPATTADRIRRIAENGSETFETRHRRKDGSLMEIEVSASRFDRPDGLWIISFCRDITERKRYEKELRESLQLNRALFDQALSSIFIADMSGRFIDVNGAACTTSGYAREELLSMTVFDLNDEAALQPRKNTLIDEWHRWMPGDHYTFESVYLRQDGSRYPVLISTGAIHYGDTKAIAAAVLDISEQKHAEHTARQLLAEKETLIREIQHRIKNNINTMTSLLSLQAHSLEEPSAIAALEDAGSRMRSLGELYDYLYATDAVDTGSLRMYLQRLVDREVAVFPYGGTVAIVCEVDECICPVRTLSSVGLIVNELITNAMKYAFRDHPDPRLTVSGSLRNGRYTLTIGDNGPGISTPKQPAPSSGFGLVVVDALTQQLDGTIRFTSNDGTEVSLEFPVEELRNGDEVRE